MLGISKTTLFRWESEGKLAQPPRDLRGHRRYGEEELRAIAELVELEPLKARIRQLYESDDPAARRELSALSERLSLDKLLYLRDLTGLHELDESPSLRPETIRRLLEEALRYETTDDVFREIIRIVYAKTNPGTFSCSPD
jgi:DNA-binding transcriptional MerR regulator